MDHENFGRGPEFSGVSGLRVHPVLCETLLDALVKGVFRVDSFRRYLDKHAVRKVVIILAADRSENLRYFALVFQLQFAAIVVEFLFGRALGPRYDILAEVFGGVHIIVEIFHQHFAEFLSILLLLCAKIWLKLAYLRAQILDLIRQRRVEFVSPEPRRILICQLHWDKCLANFAFSLCFQVPVFILMPIDDSREGGNIHQTLKDRVQEADIPVIVVEFWHLDSEFIVQLSGSLHTWLEFP